MKVMIQELFLRNYRSQRLVICLLSLFHFMGCATNTHPIVELKKNSGLIRDEQILRIYANGDVYFIDNDVERRHSIGRATARRIVSQLAGCDALWHTKSFNTSVHLGSAAKSNRGNIPLTITNHLDTIRADSPVIALTIRIDGETRRTQWQSVSATALEKDDCLNPINALITTNGQQ